MEVASQIGNSVVRCIALEATEGLACGMKVYNTGEPITVPVGDNILGRVVNVMGEAIDGKRRNHDKRVLAYLSSGSAVCGTKSGL